MAGNQILQVVALRRVFVRSRVGLFGTRPPVIAVDGVSFVVDRGEVFGLVGESGCGKSTIARCVLRLLTPTSGQVIFDGQAVTTLSRASLRSFRQRVQIVFQDPLGSLDTRMTIRQIIEEPLVIHGRGTRAERAQKVETALETVGLAGLDANGRPHELSGGQQQRVAIARALVLQPELLVLDEPFSALDVSTQAQILNLLQDLRERLRLTYLFITHDLAVAEYFCNRIGVLYVGRIVEHGTAAAIFAQPLHPYSAALLSAAPVANPDRVRIMRPILLKGEVGAQRVAMGCPFRPRCPIGRDREVCRVHDPDLLEHASRHWATCHFPGQLGLSQPVPKAGLGPIAPT